MTCTIASHEELKKSDRFWAATRPAARTQTDDGEWMELRTCILCDSSLCRFGRDGEERWKYAVATDDGRAGFITAPTLDGIALLCWALKADPLGICRISEHLEDGVPLRTGEKRYVMKMIESFSGHRSTDPSVLTCDQRGSDGEMGGGPGPVRPAAVGCDC